MCTDLIVVECPACNAHHCQADCFIGGIGSKDAMRCRSCGTIWLVDCGQDLDEDEDEDEDEG